MKYQEWPKNNEPARFSDICDSVCKAIRFAYRMQRQNRQADVPWEGMNIGESERGGCLQPHEALSASTLRWQLDDQGREALDVIVALAVQLGIEQGRRLAQRYPHLINTDEIQPPQPGGWEVSETVELTDEVRQSAVADPRGEESAIAYLVFDADGNEHLFTNYRSADSYAMRMLNDTGEETWNVFPLYAGSPVVVD